MFHARPMCGFDANQILKARKCSPLGLLVLRVVNHGALVPLLRLLGLGVLDGLWAGTGTQK